MARAVTIRGAKPLLRNNRVLYEFPDLADCPAFIERVRLYPDIDDFGFPEEIIDMPEKSFVLSQMTLQPLLKAAPRSPHIKIGSCFKFGLWQLTRFYPVVFLEFQNQDIKALILHRSGGARENPEIHKSESSV
jgi:hypothetical protein